MKRNGSYLEEIPGTSVLIIGFLYDKYNNSFEGKVLLASLSEDLGLIKASAEQHATSRTSSDTNPNNLILESFNEADLIVGLFPFP